MAERTVTLSSAGKTFSVTGWKIGWATGPRELVSAVQTAKQFLTFVSGAPFQPAIARALALPDASSHPSARTSRPSATACARACTPPGSRSSSRPGPTS